MQVTSYLIIAENASPENDKSHVIGVWEVPWSQIDEHPVLREIKAGMPEEDRRKCEKEGVLRGTIDYGYKEEHAEIGVGLVIQDLSVNVSKLSDDKKVAIREWMTTQYKVRPDTIGTDEQLQAVLNKQEVKDRIRADMTVAGMSFDTFKEAMDAYHHNTSPSMRGQRGFEERKYPSPLTGADMENIHKSMGQRFPNVKAYYRDVALKIRDEWPSPTEKNFPKEVKNSSPKSKVIYFTGFCASAETIGKTGQHARDSAWVEETMGFDRYDKNGVARNRDGEAIPAGSLQCLKGYKYLPHTVITRQFDGPAAAAVIDRWRAALDNPPNYDGMPTSQVSNDGRGTNCVSVAGRTVLGEEYGPLLARLAAIENPENGIPSHVARKVTCDGLTNWTLYGNEVPPDIRIIHLVQPDELEALRNVPEIQKTIASAGPAGNDQIHLDFALRQANLPAAEQMDRTYGYNIQVTAEREVLERRNAAQEAVEALSGLRGAGKTGDSKAAAHALHTQIAEHVATINTFRADGGTLSELTKGLTQAKLNGMVADTWKVVPEEKKPTPSQTPGVKKSQKSNFL